jgi:two-component system NtrC family sensor kinase
VHQEEWAIDLLPVPLVLTDASGLIHTCNRRFADLSGYDSGELSGTPISERVISETSWGWLKTLADMSGPAESEPSGATPVHPHRGAALYTKSGEMRAIEWSCSVGRRSGSQSGSGEAGHDGPDSEEMFFFACHDVTSRRELEQQLTQAEKLSALGQLISGVAHELNNPLTGVLGFAQIVGQDQECPEKLRQDLNYILQNASRCKAIVENLLRFARQQAPDRKPTDLREILDATVDLLAYQFRVSEIEVVKEYDKTSPETSVDFGQMQQVFVNLLMNAVQAMKAAKKGSRIVVRRRAMPNKVRVEIADDGPGIEPEIANRIFDPFFTTKPQGEGTGLGLSVCFGIVTAHRGRLWIESGDAGGACFVLELPSAASDRHTTAPRTTDSQVIRLRQRVLAVDDEDVVLLVLERMLISLGFKVLAARSAEQALEILRGNKVDIIVSDFRMPGLGGRGLYEALVANHPQLAKRIILCTGDTASREASSFLEWAKCRSVAKPFNLEQLAAALSALQMEIIEAEQSTEARP